MEVPVKIGAFTDADIVLTIHKVISLAKQLGNVELGDGYSISMATKQGDRFITDETHGDAQTSIAAHHMMRKMFASQLKSSTGLGADDILQNACAICALPSHVVSIGGCPMLVAEAVLLCVAMKLHWFSWHDLKEVRKNNAYLIPLYEIVFCVKFTDR